MRPLNFPSYRFRIKNTEKGPFIFDVIRKKFVALQPEEWVRQHAVRYLSETKGYPLSLINVEKQLLVNGLRKRYDIIVYRSDGTIFLLVECKAPKVSITQEVFDQIAIYNLELEAELLMVTNGLQHVQCKMDLNRENYDFLEEVPEFSR